MEAVYRNKGKSRSRGIVFNEEVLDDIRVRLDQRFRKLL